MLGWGAVDLLITRKEKEKQGMAQVLPGAFAVQILPRLASVATTFGNRYTRMRTRQNHRPNQCSSSPLISTPVRVDVYPDACSF